MAAPPEEQTKILDNLRQLFVGQDEGKKGYFTVEEWTRACATFFENGNPEDHAAESFKRLDLDGSGQLDYNNLLTSFEDQLKDTTTNAVDLLLNVITHNADIDDESDFTLDDLSLGDRSSRGYAEGHNEGPASQQNAAMRVGKKRGKTKRKGGQKKGAKRKSKTAKKSKAAGRMEFEGTIDWMKGAKSAGRKSRTGTKKGKKSKRKRGKAGSESQSNLHEEELSVSVSMSLPQTDAAPIASDDPAAPLPPAEPGPSAALPGDYKVWGPPSSWNTSNTQSWKRAELKDKWLPKLEAYDTPSSLQQLTPGKLKAAGFRIPKTRKAIIKKIKRLQDLEKELNPSSPVKAAGAVANADGLAPLEIADRTSSGGKRKKGRLKRSKSVVKPKGGRGRGTRKKGKKGKKGRKSGAASTGVSPMGVNSPMPPVGNVTSWATQDIEDWARSFMKPKSANNFANKVGSGPELLKLDGKTLKKLKLFKTKSGRKKVIDNVRTLLKSASQPAPSLPQGAAESLDVAAMECDMTPTSIPSSLTRARPDMDSNEAGDINTRLDAIDVVAAGSPDTLTLSLSPSSPAPPSVPAAKSVNAMPQPSPAPAPGAQPRGIIPHSAPEPTNSTIAPNEDNDASPPASSEVPPSHAHLTKPQEQPEVQHVHADGQPLDDDVGAQMLDDLDEQGQSPNMVAGDLPLESEFDSPELQSMFQMFLNMDVEGKGYLVLDQWIDACNKLFDREGESYAPISFGRLALNDRLDYAQLLISIERTVQQAEGELNPLDVFTNLVLTEKEEDVDYGILMDEEHEKRLHYIIVNVFGDVQEDHQYSYDAFKEKIKQLMPDYEEEEYRQLFDSLDHAQSGYILHRDVVAMVSNFMAQMEMGEESSDEAGREPPAHFQDGGDQGADDDILGGADILDYGSYPEPSESMIDSSERMKAAEARAKELVAVLNPEIEHMEIAVGQNEV